MKKLSLLALLLPLLLVSCSKEGGATPAATPYGDVATPAWAVDSTYDDLDHSMTAVVTVAQLGVADTSVIVPVAIDSADLIATFCGDECLSLAHPDPLGRFFLFIHAPSQPYGQITLRYYSHTLHNIFNTDTTFPFVNGGQQGTAAEPLLVPFWAVTQR